MHLHIITFILCVNHTIPQLSQYLAGNFKAEGINISKIELTVLRTEKHYGNLVLSGSSITTV